MGRVTVGDPPSDARLRGPRAVREPGWGGPDEPRYRPDRELRPDRRPAHGRAGGRATGRSTGSAPGGSTRPASSAPSSTPTGAALPHRAPPPRSRASSCTCPTPRAASPLLQPEGVGEVTDTMPVGLEPCALLRRVDVVRGEVEFRMACRPAFDYARAAPPRGSLGDRVARFTADGGTAAELRASVPLQAEGPAATAPVPAARGRERVVRAAALRGAGERWTGDVGRARHRRDARLTGARWLRAVALPGTLARDGPAVGDHAEALHLRAHRRDGRGAHLQPARDDRRRAQLGLPLRLAARLRLHGLRLPAPGLQRRGARVRGVAGGAAPRDRRRRPASCRSSTAWTAVRPHRARAGPPGGVPRLARRCGSATAPTTSSSSTSTAS